jgi:hypothetical protein
MRPESAVAVARAQETPTATPGSFTTAEYEVRGEVAACGVHAGMQVVCRPQQRAACGNAAFWDQRCGSDATARALDVLCRCWLGAQRAHHTLKVLCRGCHAHSEPGGLPDQVWCAQGPPRQRQAVRVCVVCWSGGAHGDTPRHVHMPACSPPHHACMLAPQVGPGPRAERWRRLRHHSSAVHRTRCACAACAPAKQCASLLRTACVRALSANHNTHARARAAQA